MPSEYSHSSSGSRARRPASRRSAEPSTTSRYRPSDPSRAALDSELNGLSGLVCSARVVSEASAMQVNVGPQRPAAAAGHAAAAGRPGSAVPACPDAVAPARPDVVAPARSAAAPGPPVTVAVPGWPVAVEPGQSAAPGQPP